MKTSVLNEQELKIEVVRNVLVQFDHVNPINTSKDAKTESISDVF